MFGLIGDPFYNIWVFANLAGAKLSVSALIPNVDPNHILLPSQPLIDIQASIFSHLFGATGAYNLIITLGFILTFVASYLLAGKLFSSRLARIFSALVITFLPFRLAHSQVHINMVSTQWLIFSIYFLFCLKEKRTIIYSVLLSIFLGLTFLDNYQYGLFAIFAISIFAVYELVISVTGRKLKEFGILVLTLALSGIVLLALMAVFDHKIISALTGQTSIGSLGAVRNFDELKVYSGHILYYLLPSPMLVFLSEIFKGQFQDKARELGTNTVEQTLFLGWIPIALALAGLFIRNQKKNYKIYLVLLAALAIIFSIAPTISIFGATFNSPAYFLFEKLPVIRVYARFGLLVGIAISLLAGYTIEKISDKKYSSFLVIALALVCLVEFYPKDVLPIQNTGNPPQVYVELAKLEPGIVAEYPLLPAEEPKSYDYLLWQTYHHFPLVYGSSANSEGETLRKSLVNPSSPETIAKLKANGVRYIIVHKKKYIEGDPRKYPAEYNGGQVPVISSESVKSIVSTGEAEIYSLK